MASESSWLSWVKMENQEMMITFPIDRHIRAVGWSLAMIAFGFLILAFDTRPIPPRRHSALPLRDRIVGMEQRYFLVVLNGILMYGALVYIFQNGGRS